MNKNSKIYVAGHQGLVGSTLVRQLHIHGYTNIITKTFEQLDLRNQQAVMHFFNQECPEYVFLAAAKVGGIYANMQYPAQFIYDNIMIAAHCIDAAYKSHIKKLLFLGSSCIYPRNCLQPISENYLMTGPLEKTNESYALAKITGIQLCKAYNQEYGTNFISCMPTNLYGPYDNFDLETSHVLPALIAKMVHAHDTHATSVTIWGTGTVRREFLYVEDCAQALLFLMNEYSGNVPLNVGTGQDLTIAELAFIIKDIVGFKGVLVFDESKPDGTPQKILDVQKITALGWQAKTSLYEGIKKTVKWYKSAGTAELSLLSLQ